MKIRALTFTALLSAGPCSAESGQWIAVVAPGLRDSVKPLAEQRRAEGWTVTLLDAAPNSEATLPQVAALTEKGGPCCVVLVGDMSEKAGPFHVPPGKGQHLRMKARPTDFPWSSGGAKGVAVETGRLPARNEAEAKTMVAKILAWPQGFAGGPAFPSATLLAGHHGAPEAFSKIADGLNNTLALRLLAKLPPAWTFDGAVHIDGSPWQISGEDIPATALRLMQTRSTFLAYMGHSSEDGAMSKSTPLLGTRAWRDLPANTPRPGLFFTCGCNSCEIAPGVEAYGFTAMRAPGGPPAVIGSHGLTWAAMGYLAISGLIERTAADPAPLRLGSYWLGVQAGLREGEISATEFALLDMADGTGGQVPLDQQRLEHLESWMLLGDPAMPLVPADSGIRFTAGKPEAGKPLTVSGTLPAALSGTALRITLDRQAAAVPADLPVVPGSGAGRTKVAQQRRRLALSVRLASVECTADGTAFRGTLPLPAPLPPPPWTLRVETLQPPHTGTAQTVTDR